MVLLSDTRQGLFNRKGMVKVKISFSTLGCPDFEWSDIYSMAKDLGFDGIEIRGVGNDIDAINARPFSALRLQSTIKKLKELRLEIPCLSTGCALNCRITAMRLLIRYINIQTLHRLLKHRI